MKIRPASPEDADAATEVIRRAYAPWRAKLPDLPDVASGVAEDIATGPALVAEVDGTVTGILLAKADPGTLHIMNIAVSPDAKGQGIGSALMRAIEAHARADSTHTLYLATHRDMPGNVALYEHLGWTVTGRDGTKILMERHLPSLDRSG